MSNRIINQLHDLIKSLTSAEKRYFKLYSERHHTKEKKNYIQLFNKIDKQAIYNEELILNSFEDQTFVKHFSIAKNRLYNQILRSLDAFHASKSTEAELNQNLHYAEILYQKALYGQCERVLNTAQKLAVKHEKWGPLIQIIRRQKRLAENDHYEKNKGVDIEALFQLEQDTLKKINAESELWFAKSKVFLKLFQKGQVRDKSEATSLAKEVAEIVKNSASAPSFEAAYLANHTESVYFFSLGDYSKSYEALKKNKALIEENLEVIKDEPGIYIAVLTNLVYVTAKLNKFEEVDLYLRQSRNLPATLTQQLTEDLELRIFTNTYSLELAICNILGNVSRGIPLCVEIEEILPKWEPRLSDVRRASFYHSISTMFFVGADFKKALLWNNALLNSVPIDTTEDQFCFAQMFHLLIHLEMENYDVIPYTLKSLKRHLDTRKRQFKFEKIFMEFMKNVSKSAGDKSEMRFIQEFSAALSVLEKDPFEKTVFEYFDFQAWAEAKITNQPIAKVLQVKAPEKDIL